MQAQFFEMYRAGLKTTADMMAASLENAERLQQQQLDALHSAIDAQLKSARELAEVKSLEELVALQTRLAGTQLERTMDFWSRMWRAAGDSQASMLGRAQSQASHVIQTAADTRKPPQPAERKSA